MRQLNKFMEIGEFEELMHDFEFEAQVLEKNSREADLLIKKGYRIKKPVWQGLIAS